MSNKSEPTKVETQEETIKEKIEIKLLWLSHTLTDREKIHLEECVFELITGCKPDIDNEREHIAFNRGLIWATKYLTNRNCPTLGDRKKDNE